MGWGKTLNSDQQQALEKLASVLARKLQANPISAALPAPANLTIKTPRGQYKKLSFVGGDLFTFHSAYCGKTGVVLIGKPAIPKAEVQFIEVMMDKAGEYFSHALTSQLNDHLTGAFERAEAELKAAADEAMREERERLEDPAFGSW